VSSQDHAASKVRLFRLYSSQIPEGYTSLGDFRKLMFRALSIGALSLLQTTYKVKSAVKMLIWYNCHWVSWWHFWSIKWEILSNHTPCVHYTTVVHRVPRPSLWKDIIRKPIPGIVQHLLKSSLGTL
jgi:hypothetical protein